MDELDYYRHQSRLTDPGSKRHLFRGLPADVAAMAEVIGGVLVHRDCTVRFGFTLPEQRRDEANTRHVEAILNYLDTLDERHPQARFAGTCRDFAVLLCAMLREAGIPARARAGFAGYFTNGFFDDHWVVEVWNDKHGWHLVDAQVASAPTGTYTDADIDPLNVPRDAFLVGGQAWQECRTGGRDLDRIGTSAAGLTGMWEVQGNVIRDLAALNRVETLPWDEWGSHPRPLRPTGPRRRQTARRYRRGQCRRWPRARSRRRLPQGPPPARPSPTHRRHPAQAGTSRPSASHGRRLLARPAPNPDNSHREGSMKRPSAHRRPRQFGCRGRRSGSPFLYMKAGWKFPYRGALTPLLSISATIFSTSRPSSTRAPSK
jgi:hypothetical protein